MRKLKTTFKFICHNRAKKKASLWASLLFQMSQSSKRSLPLATIWLRITYLFYRLLWKLVLLKTAEILVLRTVIKIWFFSLLSGFASRFFFSVPVFISCSFNLFFFFCYWQLRSVYLFFRLCHFSLIFVPVFISCLFRGDEWHNYFTSVIDLYNQLLSKISPFRTSGDFSITNSLKFGFSLFCRVLLLAFFSYMFLLRVIHYYFLVVIMN